MSFSQKATIFSIIILLGLPLGGYWYYKNRLVRRAAPPPRPEVEITIIPGWNLRQIAEYLVKENIAENADAVFSVVGKPAFNYQAFKKEAPRLALDLPVLLAKPEAVSYEGYLAPETYRVYKDASLAEVVNKLVKERDAQITPQMHEDIKASGRSAHDVLTMASILEEEARDDLDRAKVADILWRRYDRKWALQVDPSVHYAIGKVGNVFTTQKERAVDSLWNTYKYPGLPLGPISNPSLTAIKAALYPIKNNYWYFLSGRDGTMYYGKTLEEHNANKKYL